MTHTHRITGVRNGPIDEWLDQRIDGRHHLQRLLPATRVAVKAFDPVFLTVARAAIARARFQHRRLAPCPQGPAQDGAGSSAF
jgi:hypothetical protein